MSTYLLLAGTRPEAVKLSPLAAALRKAGQDTAFCAIGQHGDLLTDTLSAFGEAARYAPVPFVPGRSPQSLLSAILTTLPPLLSALSPAGVIVQGDTTTAFGGALAAYYGGQRLIHVEAGLRTYSRDPYPEEGHRRMIAPLAHLHLCPTDADKDALLAERVPGRIAITGNSGLDGLRMILERPAPSWPDELPTPTAGRLLLCTLHRRENEATLPSLLEGLSAIARAVGDCTVLFPAHPTPALAQALAGARLHERVVILPPLGYPVCAHLLKRISLLLTDSGGLQEEAAYLGIPTLVLRRASERGDAPSLRIIGTSPARMVTEAVGLLRSPAALNALSIPSTRYGDGHAAERMAGEILSAGVQRQSL